MRVEKKKCERGEKMRGFYVWREENEREKNREKIGWSFDKENKKWEGSTCGEKRNEREKKLVGCLTS